MNAIPGAQDKVIAHPLATARRSELRHTVVCALRRHAPAVREETAMSWTTFVSLLTLVTLSLPSSAEQKPRDPLPESFTATAQFLGPRGSAETTFQMRVQRYTPDAEREAVLQALTQGGYVGFLTALRKAPVVGSVEIGGHIFDIRWARESPIENGRSIVLVTDKPMFFIGAGSPTAKPRKGYEVGLISFHVDDAGMGSGGRMAAAARVKTGATGIEIADYAEKPIELRTVKRDVG
jgi:hypothetical protein